MNEHSIQVGEKEGILFEAHTWIYKFLSLAGLLHDISMEESDIALPSALYGVP